MPNPKTIPTLRMVARIDPATPNFSVSRTHNFAVICRLENSPKGIEVIIRPALLVGEKEDFLKIKR